MPGIRGVSGDRRSRIEWFVGLRELTTAQFECTRYVGGRFLWAAGLEGGVRGGEFACGISGLRVQSNRFVPCGRIDGTFSGTSWPGICCVRAYPNVVGRQFGRSGREVGAV